MRVSMDNLEIELKLTVANVNLILGHLSKGAYSEVADLIAIIRGQSLPQLNAAQAAKAGEESAPPPNPVPEQASE